MVTPDNTIRNFITQSALIQYFTKNVDKLGKFADFTLSELGFTPKQVTSVDEHFTALEAFKLLSEQVGYSLYYRQQILMSVHRKLQEFLLWTVKVKLSPTLAREI